MLVCDDGQRQAQVTNVPTSETRSSNSARRRRRRRRLTMCHASARRKAESRAAFFEALPGRAGEGQDGGGGGGELLRRIPGPSISDKMRGRRIRPRAPAFIPSDLLCSCSCTSPSRCAAALVSNPDSLTTTLASSCCALPLLQVFPGRQNDLCGHTITNHPVPFAHLLGVARILQHR